MGKRYSREFEDLPLVTSSSSPTSRPAMGSSSIEQLLSEVEKEVHGPDYRYIPPSDDSEDGSSVTYTSIRRANDAIMRPRCHTSPDALQLPRRRPRRGVSPLATHKTEPDPDYDNLKPRAAPEQRRAVGSYVTVHFSPSPSPAEHSPRTSPDGEAGEGLEDHDYEELPAVQDDDFDSYVYMAPSRDKKEKSFNSGKK